MKKIKLGFKAYDLHELTCHFVARYAGLYAERGLDVTLEDTRLVPDDQLPESLFSVACGSALIRWLQGAKLKVIVVAVQKPMFWLHSSNHVETIEDLFAKTVATYPAAAPPAQFLRIILEDAGLQPDCDVHLAPAVDDAARLEMLRSGRASAALISSATLPHRVTAPGFGVLLCLGDRIRVPTTGLAVSLTTFERDSETVTAVRDSLRAALRLINRDETILRAALRESDLVDARDVDGASKLVRQFFTVDGRIRSADVVTAVERVADSLALPVPANAASLYDQCCAP